MNTLTLTNSTLSTSTAVRLLNGGITYAWKNLVNTDPAIGSFDNIEAQYNGWENPTFKLVFHIPTDNIPASTMTWSLWNEFVKNSSTTNTTLNMSLGSSDTAFAEYSAGSTGDTVIPIIVRNYSLTFGPGDSNDSNFWTINANVQVTK